MVRKGELGRHPESEIFPRMSPNEFQSLVASMKVHGFDGAFPIFVHDDAIVDGWHRYKAAKEAGVDPVFQEWKGDGTDVRDFVIYANSTRRHMSKAAHAQALVRSNLGRETKMSTKAIAQLAGVSIPTVNEQERIREKAPDVADQIADGNMPATVGRRKVLKKADDDRIERRPYWLTGVHTKRVMTMALDIGETFDGFCRKAIAERIERTEKAGNQAA